MIKLDNLELKNFLSHIDTSLPLTDYNGLVLVEGKSEDGHYSSNGSGKSTLLEGIVYSLTGETLRGVAVNDVVNRNQKKNTKSSLEFSKDGTSYKVSRYRKDDIHGDNIILEKDGKDISKRVNKETQSSINDILGISYKVLVSTMLLGEGLSSRFTQLSDPEKKSLIESTLNLSYDMNKIREVANSRLKDCKLKLATIEGEISVLSGLAEENIELLEDSIHDLRACIEIYEQTLSHLKEKSETLMSEIADINPKLNLISNTINTINSLDRDKASKSVEFQELSAKLHEVTSSESPVCALCNQVLQSEDSINAVVNQYKSSMYKLHQEIEEINNSLYRLPDIELLKQKEESLKLEYNEKYAKHQDISRDYNAYTVKIAEAQKDIDTTLNTISSIAESHTKLESKKKEQEELRAEIQKYEYFYKLFSPTGIINNILTESINYINSRLYTYSSILLEKDYRIEFLKGKISLVDSKGSNYQSLSNGEKRRLDIAIQFSIHDYVHRYCGSSVDTMFIDEILDTLDDVGIENIITVLRLKLEYCNLARILVISHNSELKSYFDNVVTVVKDSDGNSKIKN